MASRPDPRSPISHLRISMVLVRLLLFLALATIAVAALMYLVKRDRRYLRFIGQVVKYTIFLLVGVLLFVLFERLLIAL